MRFVDAATEASQLPGGMEFDPLQSIVCSKKTICCFSLSEQEQREVRQKVVCRLRKLPVGGRHPTLGQSCPQAAVKKSSNADVVHVAETCLTDGGSQRVEEAIHHIKTKVHLGIPVPCMRADEDHKRPGIGLSVVIEDGLGDGGNDLLDVSHNHTRPPPTNINRYQDRPASEQEAFEQHMSGPVDEQVVVDRRVLDVLGIQIRKHAQAPVSPGALGPVEEPK